MRFLLLFFALSFLAPTVSPLRAQEDKPLTLDQEKAGFNEADAALNRSYQKAKKALPEWEFKELQEDQRKWLEFRDGSSLSAAVFDGGPQFEGNEKSSAAYWETMKYLTQTRARIIEGWVAEADRELSWEGEWTDGYGGWLRIVRVAETRAFRFDLEVVRGPTHHMGQISGRAKINDSMAFFTDEGTEDKTAEDPETWLIFEKDFSGPRLEITGINTGYYHGMRAFFTGIYTRIGDLSDEGKKEVLTGP